MFTIRQAEPEDVEAACSVMRRSIVECCHEDHAGDRSIVDAWLANKTPETVRSWFQSGGYAVVAERDGAVVGTAMLDGEGFVTLCYLVPEARYEGIGKGMLGALEAEARKRGQKHIELGSTKTAYRFYQRNGYADTGRVESAFGLTAVIMRKAIGGGH